MQYLMYYFFVNFDFYEYIVTKSNQVVHAFFEKNKKSYMHISFNIIFLLTYLSHILF